MDEPNKLEKLRRALGAEKADRAARFAEYTMLLDKMKAYQDGTGPAPSIEEFKAWRSSVEEQIAERKLQSGFSDLS